MGQAMPVRLQAPSFRKVMSMPAVECPLVAEVALAELRSLWQSWPLARTPGAPMMMTVCGLQVCLRTEVAAQAQPLEEEAACPPGLCNPDLGELEVRVRSPDSPR